MHNEIKLTEAQQKLVTDHHDLIYIVLRKKGWPIEKYYDVAALGLCKAASTYTPGKSKFSTYAETCIENTVKNEIFREHAHSRSAYTEVSLDDLLSGSDDSTAMEDVLISCDEGNPESYAMMEDTLTAIDKLPPRERMIIKLAMEGYTQCEISERLGIPHSTVGWTLRNTKKMLREYLE